ncbi:MAG: 2-succinyl-5-enolpyruvyl-6-hydroxy-3-cyclohexene-1-carboxylic-acid synthase [Actinobacteria bacterium]|nr:2-succinyl-5-enolpyruvyl-6-hydroxy-3-cyclohexene-1-carboxylic-acid synthase [Actinomycetota bacterium]
MNDSTLQAEALADALYSVGVRDVVIAPGSRSAPLALALARRDQFNRHIHIDERSAGFVALGISKASGRPVATVCTSGTATANFHPAVLEASHSDVPLIVITADRPSELQGIGSNQTTNQSTLYGSALRHFLEIEAGTSLEWIDRFNSAVDGLNGPMQINIAFREPLLPEGEADTQVIPAFEVSAQAKKMAPTLSELGITSGQRGVVVVGHGLGTFSRQEISAWATRLGWPVVAEDPLSHSAAIQHASLLVGTTFASEKLQPEVALVIGKIGLSRSVMALITRTSRVIGIDSHHEVSNPLRKNEVQLAALPRVDVDADPNWLKAWHQASAKVADALALPTWSEQKLAAIFARSLSSGSSLFIGSSRPIRDIEAFAAPRADIGVFGNRGLAGIDGNISTAIGISRARSGRTFAYLGDIAFLHDINALLNDAPDLTVVVVDNNGGGIFSTLPQRGIDHFEEIFGTPHNRDLTAIASGFGVHVTRVANLKDFERALAEDHSVLNVIIAVMPSRDINADNLKIAIATAEKALTQ